MSAMLSFEGEEKKKKVCTNSLIFVYSVVLSIDSLMIYLFKKN